MAGANEVPAPARGREPGGKYECRCVLVYTATGTEVRDVCHGPSIPDTPFCPSCVERHPDMANDHIEVRVR